MVATRIASLISSATEMVYLLGLGERLVGVSHECDYPSDVAAKPRLTRSLVDAAATSRAIDQQVHQLAATQSALYEIDVERLAALRPDVIITQAQCDVCAVRYEDVVSAVDQTPALRHARVVALNPHTLADVLADIRLLGDVLDAPAAAAAALRTLDARLAAVNAQTTAQAASPRPRVACLEWIDPPMLAANWTPELVERAGGQCGLAQPAQHSVYARWEQIVDYDPEVIVIMPCGFDLPRAISEAQALPAMGGWNDLAAVRGDRVFAVDGNAYFNRSGPRLVDSVEILAHLFHPNLFAPPAMANRPWQRLTTRAGALVPEIEHLPRA
jgi:iron complex transport system substrate-binding protein